MASWLGSPSRLRDPDATLLTTAHAPAEHTCTAPASHTMPAPSQLAYAYTHCSNDLQTSAHIPTPVPFPFSTSSSPTCMVFPPSMIVAPRQHATTSHHLAVRQASLVFSSCDCWFMPMCISSMVSFLQAILLAPSIQRHACLFGHLHPAPTPHRMLLPHVRCLVRSLLCL